MKKVIRNSVVLACAVMSFVAASAHAEQGDMLRMSQSRLNDLGYYSGRTDGVLGPVTHTALMDFQASNGLPVTGTLNAETFNLLIRADYSIRHGANLNQVVQVSPGYMQYVAPTTTHIAYYSDGNGYVRYVNAPTAIVAQPTFTPVSYTYGYGAQPVVYAHY